MMKFASNAHEQFYEAHTAPSDEQEKKALVYTLGIDDACRSHFARLFDTDLNCIRPEGLREGWQTGASKRITRLAYNLYTWEIAEGDDPAAYTPYEIFFGMDKMHKNGILMALSYFA